MKASVVTMAHSLFCIWSLTFFYLMAQIKESPVHISVTIIYVVGIVFHLTMFFIEAIKLDNKIDEKGDDK